MVFTDVVRECYGLLSKSTIQRREMGEGTRYALPSRRFSRNPVVGGQLITHPDSNNARVPFVSGYAVGCVAAALDVTTDFLTHQSTPR